MVFEFDIRWQLKNDLLSRKTHHEAPSVATVAIVAIVATVAIAAVVAIRFFGINTNIVRFRELNSNARITSIVRHATTTHGDVIRERV